MENIFDYTESKVQILRNVVKGLLKLSYKHDVEKYIVLIQDLFERTELIKRTNPTLESGINVYEIYIEEGLLKYFEFDKISEQIDGFIPTYNVSLSLDLIKLISFAFFWEQYKGISKHIGHWEDDCKLTNRSKDYLKVKDNTIDPMEYLKAKGAIEGYKKNEGSTSVGKKLYRRG